MWPSGFLEYSSDSDFGYNSVVPTNIEIKFRVADLQPIELAAAEYADSGPELIVQEDVFFNVNSGRLKLRKFADGFAELSKTISSVADPQL